MGLSLFQSNKPQNNILNQVNQIKQMMNNQNPNVIAQQMMKTNPQFAQFVNQCQGKSVEQICKEYGINFNALQSALR